MVAKKRSKCCCCKCKADWPDGVVPDGGVCDCGSALWGGELGETLLEDNCVQGTAVKGLEIDLRDGDQDQCDDTDYSFQCARHCCECIMMYKTKDYLDGSTCSYCSSDSKEIAIEIDGVGYAEKEGLFVAEKSGNCEWKYDLTDDGSELLINIYSDDIEETFIMVRWVDEDKFPLFFWTATVSEINTKCVWEELSLEGEDGNCTIYSMED